jgi:hypothetical protein
MSLTVEKVTLAATKKRCDPAAGQANSKLNIAVVFTSIEPTLAALRKAGALASRLRACITLIVPQVVPYPLPLNRPPVPRDFTERHFRVMADESPVETKVQVYLCRDRIAALRGVLKPHSLVVIGGSKSWWPTREKRLARQLRRSGHEVVFAEA